MTRNVLSVQARLAHKTGFRLNVSFEVPAGVTILSGPSGAGKSTTLSLIAGLITPDEGRITLGQEVWLDTKARVSSPTHTRRIAFVFQSLALFPHMTALENAEYGLSRAMRREERRAHAEGWLARMKVSHLSARRPASFSGGEAQRVALARAFAMSPRVVLLDEAFSSLDRALRSSLAEEVKRYAREQELPVLQVTHDTEEAKAIGDRFLRMEAGEIIQE